MSRQLSADDQNIDVAPISLRTNATFSFFCWFNSPDNASGSGFAYLYIETLGFPVTNAFSMKTSGVINWFTRDSSSNAANFDTTNAFDDGAWHWFLAVKRSDTDREMWVDGISENTSSSNSTTAGTITSWRISGTGSLRLPNGARLARVVRLPRVVLSLAEARYLAYYGPGSRRYNDDATWYELKGDQQEPEFFNNGTPGVVNGGMLPGGNEPFRDIPDPVNRRVLFVPPPAVPPSLVIAPYTPAEMRL